MDRLDWSFASVDGAVNALLASDTVVAAPRETVAAFAADDLRRGADGRLRFSFCPATVVVAWSEMTLPPPPIAPLPTLLLRPVGSQFPGGVEDRRYREELGPALTLKAVPNGHNLLWESPRETIAAILEFLAAERLTAIAASTSPSRTSQRPSKPRSSAPSSSGPGTSRRAVKVQPGRLDSSSASSKPSQRCASGNQAL